MWQIRMVGWGQFDQAKLVVQVADHYGHIKALEDCLRRNTSEEIWNVLVSYHAARGGQLEVLKYLRSQEYPCPLADHEYTHTHTHKRIVSSLSLSRTLIHLHMWADRLSLSPSAKI